MFTVRYKDKVCCCLFPCEECGGDSTTMYAVSVMLSDETIRKKYLSTFSRILIVVDWIKIIFFLIDS